MIFRLIPEGWPLAWRSACFNPHILRENDCLISAIFCRREAILYSHWIFQTKLPPEITNSKITFYEKKHLFYSSHSVYNEPTFFVCWQNWLQLCKSN